jgi:hypothetical protein
MSASWDWNLLSSSFFCNSWLIEKDIAHDAVTRRTAGGHARIDLMSINTERFNTPVLHKTSQNNFPVASYYDLDAYINKRDNGHIGYSPAPMRKNRIGAICSGTLGIQPG